MHLTPTGIGPKSSHGFQLRMGDAEQCGLENTLFICLFVSVFFFQLPISVDYNPTLLLPFFTFKFLFLSAL